MRQLTVQELTLIFSVLAILVVGACVKQCRQGRLQPPPPELEAPLKTEALKAINHLEEDD